MTAVSPKLAGLLAALRDVTAAGVPSEVEAHALGAARGVLQADAAFWMDERDGRLEMAATSGVVRPEVHQLTHLPPGVGLAGAVLDRDEPIAWTDYASEPAGSEAFRMFAQLEGITSLAGAPMRGPDRVEGVLLVMTRERRVFTVDELHLLLAFASMARALRERAREHAALERRAAELAERLRASERLEAGLEGLIGSLLRGQPLAHGLTTASDMLGFRLHVDGAPVPGLDVPGREDDGAAGRGAHVPIPGVDGARLTAEGHVPARQLTVLAQVVALEFARQRASVETETRLTDEFLHGLCTADAEGLRRLERRSGLLGIDLDVPRAVVTIGHDRPVDRWLLERIHREMRARVGSGHLTTFDGDVILLWPVPDPDSERRLPGQIRDVLAACRSRRLLLTAGIGPVARGVTDYPDAVREALFARQVAVYSSTDRTIATSADLGMYRMFAHIGGIEALRGAVVETLGPLLDADRQGNSDLTHTLRVYLEKDRRLAETARALHVHVNTLRYRVERISSLLSADLDDPEVRFFTTLALRLVPVLGVGPAGQSEGGAGTRP
ncbi:helix-turn-helix domain-containing protein [Streptomyces sp. NPDC002888]|uniref:helix-turn-helix domain-containing protein n=1 Tax=Streptomyces sp. NPDC002888 TaxID=3364668 RepID=UPI0036D175FE